MAFVIGLDSREGHKIKQTILRHVGVADDEGELRRLKELAQVLLRQLREAEAPQLLLPAAAARGPAAVSQAALKVDLRHLQEQQRQITGIHTYPYIHDHTATQVSTCRGGVGSNLDTSESANIVTPILGQFPPRTLTALKTDLATMKQNIEEQIADYDRIPAKVGKPSRALPHYSVQCSL